MRMCGASNIHIACSDNRKGAGEEQGRIESVRRRATQRGCVAGGNAVMGALANYPGYMMVTLSVTPFSAGDNATTTTVDSALASGNLTIGGAPSGVSDLVLSGEPDTRILLGSKNRPKGRTNPMTDDGSIPGQLMEEPERTNKAMFQWKVWFGDTECTCLLYTSPSPRDKRQSRMPSSA